MKTKSIFFLLFIICIQVAGYSQEKGQQWPVIISVFSEAWSLPSTQFIKEPIHPGLSVGTAYNLRATSVSTISLGGSLGYFYHKNFQNNFHLLASLGYERRVVAGLSIGTALGAGYSHSFYPTPVYQLEGGEYKRATDWGKSTFMPSLDVHLDYTFGRKTDNPITLFSKYQLLLEWPYAPENTFPILPHTALHAGVKFYPFR